MIKEIELNGKKIRFRKWKVKDKRNLDKAQTTPERRQIFVYDCLEDPNTPLDIEEYNYVLACIRDFSLHTPLNYEVECPDCRHKIQMGQTALQVVEPIYARYSLIEFKGHSIEVGGIRDKQTYESAILKAVTAMERYITDFALHILKIDGNDVTSIEEVVAFIEDLDVDDYESVFEQWDSMRFKCNVIHPVECPECKKTHDIDFSDMPTFFPASWGIE